MLKLVTDAKTLQNAFGAMMALVILGVIFVGPMVLAVSAGSVGPLSHECYATLTC